MSGDPVEASSAALGRLGHAFALPGELVAAAPLGSGHIHDTFVVTREKGGVRRRFVHQRLNTHVFREPELLMRNLERVTRHLRAKLLRAGRSDTERRHLQLVPARDGRPFHVDEEGSYWRTTVFVEGTRSVDALEGPEQAFEAGRAFGAFAELLADLGPLEDTIPHFHDLASRAAALEAAIAADVCGRAAAAAAEIDAARERRAFLERALAEVGADDLPRRLVHNDCKLNNLLLDAASGEGLCVIDLDTVMEGTLLCDFGELVRTGTSGAAEDERDLSRVGFDLELFGALARGYVSGAGALLTGAERRALPVAGIALSLENGIRFLTDHLSGDAYFRARREGHNLDRCRTQLRLAARMCEELDAARRAVERA